MCVRKGIFFTIDGASEALPTESADPEEIEEREKMRNLEVWIDSF